MYFHSKTVLAVAALVVAARAVPCEEDDGDCIGMSKSCIGETKDCCPGLDCFGFNFFKRCQEPPVCLEE